jgi:uncharacterized membrane protein YhaH (DUF805 family)
MGLQNAAFSFQGRIGRLRFLGYGLLLGVVIGLIFGVAAYFLMHAKHAGNRPVELIAMMICVCMASLFIWSVLALQVKRLHDMNFSAYYLLGFLALAGLIGACRVIYPEARYIGYVLNVFSFIIFYCVPGSPTRNDFGDAMGRKTVDCWR